ncbi:MAG TPA: hypothetical protein VG872_05995 [Acidimicrobiia bacterium]|nr:hypothetical protein [Acidimicrobiia bacterium]
MAVELDGNVRMRGDNGPGVRVTVVVGDRRLRLMSGDEVVGDWLVSDIGINALQDGFKIRAEGEEFVLRTSDDVALAEEIGVGTASPRLARRLAARHNPEDRTVESEPTPIPSNLAAIGFAVGGALIVLGGVFLDRADPGRGGFQFWLTFVIGGVLMVGVSYVMSLGSQYARLIATGVVVAMIATFGFAVSGRAADVDELTSYGFIAGGLVVGVAVLVSGGPNRPR